MGVIAIIYGCVVDHKISWGGEHMADELLRVANNAVTQLVQSIDASNTALTVLDGSKFPEPPFMVTVDNEIIKVGARTESTFSSLTRGAENTVAASHTAGSYVENRWTAAVPMQLRDAFVSHKDDDDNPHGVKAEQVGYDNTVSELEATTVQGAIDEVEADLLSHKEDYVSHINSDMPHQFKDLKNNKIYQFGFQVSADGEPQIVYEEVLL